MARIRTIKPEFWEDDVIGTMSRDERLLFIATWTLADDEGLLRWSAAYLKASAFIYDADITSPKVEKMMARLVEAGLIFAYAGGKAQQPFGYIVNFHKHQRINRPSPSRLPPPSIQNLATKEMYGRRDGWRCHLCLGEIDQTYAGNDDLILSMDHVVPIASGGSDYPSNIKAAHVTCNKGRCNRSVESYRELLKEGKTAGQRLYPERFTHTLTESIIERPPTERERERERESGNEIDPGKEEAREDARATPRDELAKVLDETRAEAVLEHRRKMRKPLTAHAAALLAGKFAKCRDPNAAADMMIANGWQGFEPEWMENRRANGPPQQKPNYAKIAGTG